MRTAAHKALLHKGSIPPVTMMAGAFIALVSIASVIFLPSTPTTSMMIEPIKQSISRDNTFTIDVVVASDIPVNVFAGELYFDTSVLNVQSINYNTSIADLWAERPWYSNGDGTLNFIGGTTKSGGFVGEGTLLSITFLAHSSGEAVVTFESTQILQHDGLGTLAELEQPIDAIFTVPQQTNENTVTTIQSEAQTSEIKILEEDLTTDLNGDGKQTITDISIFMQYLAIQDERADFDRDGNVDFGDLTILRNAR